MKNERFLLGMGIWIAVLPYLGFPYVIKNILFLMTGLLFVYMASVVYYQNRAKKIKARSFENFTENNIEE